MDENQIGAIIVDCAAHKKQLLTVLKSSMDTSEQESRCLGASVRALLSL